MSNITPAAVGARLVAISDELERKATEYADLAVEAAVAEVNYRREYAIALLKAKRRKVTDKEAEACATVDCAELLMTRKNAEAVADACRQSIGVLKSRSDTLRSLNANVRSLAS